MHQLLLSLAFGWDPSPMGPWCVAPPAPQVVLPLMIFSGELKDSEKNLSHCHFVLHKSHMEDADLLKMHAHTHI
jgi:hypothetical protein